MRTPALEHDLVDVAVERRVRQAGEDADAAEVVEDAVGGLPDAARRRLEVRQDPVAARVQPVAWAGRRVALGETGRDGARRTLVV